MDLSIIIPAYNEEKLIAKTIGKVQTAVSPLHEQGITTELIVCDNNSTDNTAVLAREAGATIVFEPDNHIAKARNTGAAHAQGQWFLFVDADTYPSPELMTDIHQAMQKPDVLGCSSTIKVSDAPFWYRLNLEGQNINLRLFKTLLGLFCLCRADVFAEIGGFNTNLYAFEDLDFVNRLKKYGRKTNQKYLILHKHPVTTSGRKGILYNRWEMTNSFITALYYFLTNQKPENPEKMPFWYDGRR
ncbi:MAG: glycosyltransferase [Chloroflexota bacterium]